MNLSTLSVFALVMLVGIATPGPTVLLAMSNASRFGIRRAGFGMAGAVTADLMLVGLVGLGLGAVLAASELLFVTLKWLGAAWLAYVGFRMLRSQGPIETAAEVERLTPARKAMFLRSFFIAMSNPKYYLFMTALLPQFVDRRQAIAPQYALLAATVVLIDLVVMAGYAMLGVKSVALFKARGVRWMNRISGSLLLLLAGSVALYRKSAS
jgi:threonine/homoserine/homoserine lactone efflux protein